MLCSNKEQSIYSQLDTEMRNIWAHADPKTSAQEQHVITFHGCQPHCSLVSFLYLEEHGAVLVCIRRLNMIWRAGVSSARGAHDDAFPRLPLQTPCQAAAARPELLRLLKPRILQDALGESSSKAALTGAATQAFTWNIQQRYTRLFI